MTRVYFRFFVSMMLHPLNAASVAIQNANAYVLAYPEYIKSFQKNCLVWADGIRMPLAGWQKSAYEKKDAKNTSGMQQEMHKHKNFQQALENPDLLGQISLVYCPGKQCSNPITDPGRIRYDPLFQKLYGSCEAAVKKNLVSVKWMPKIFGSAYTLLFTRINAVDQRIGRISEKLEKLVEKHPEYKIFLDNPGGTFHWRTIKGTKRISAHSYGMTMDINATKTHYWLWDYKKEQNIARSTPVLEKNIPQEALPSYRNTVPLEIVEIFESEGFIWGGKWRHYDTMHFEYRPELLVKT